MTWYYMKSGRRIGPITDAEFEGAVREGRIRSETQVRREDMEQWAPFAAVPFPSPPDGTVVADLPSAATATNRICSICGKTYEPKNLIGYRNHFVCWSCKPAFLQRLQEGAEVPGALVYAGFWIRAAAKLIDWVLLGIASFALGTALELLVRSPLSFSRDPRQLGPFLMFRGLLTVLNIGIAAAYTTWFLGKHAATPGKMALGLKVVTSTGGRVSYARAFGRHFAEWVSGTILMIGYLMAGFDGQMRALHDRICDTRVVRT